MSFQRPDLSTLNRSQWDVTLGTGRVVSLADVEYDTQTKQFVWARGTSFIGVNVTDRLSRPQKNAFPGYDPTEDNIRASDEHQRALGREPAAVGSTSVLDNFLGNVAEDFSGVGRFAAGTGLGWNLRTVMTLGLTAAALWFGWQIVKELR